MGRSDIIFFESFDSASWHTHWKLSKTPKNCTLSSAGFKGKALKVSVDKDQHFGTSFGFDFSKFSLAEPHALRGHNMAVRQNGLPGPWIEVLRHGEPIRYALYTVQPVRPRGPRQLLPPGAAAGLQPRSQPAAAPGPHPAGLRGPHLPPQQGPLPRM
jgi:hypothetical protein